LTNLQNTNIAVTGGCGFIGSHLVERLRSRAARVLAIDSLAYGRRENLDGSDPDLRIEQLELREGSSGQLKHILKGIDYVFHLAAEKHNQSIHSPVRVLDANVIGTYELLKAAADAGVKKVVFTSSLYAYGRMSGLPMTEDEAPAPHTIYGISKLAGEHLCRHFSMHGALPAVCLRLFFVYGPRQYTGLGYKSVIVKNFDRILNGQKPLIFGDGTQRLDYVYVDDVVSALLLAMAGEDTCEVFNVGSGSGVSVNELTALMMKVAGVKTSCEYGPSDPTHGSSRVASTKKFDEHFGVQTTVPIGEGLRRTLDWMTSSQR
jgi:UDP-glucose 4-epimerase